MVNRLEPLDLVSFVGGLNLRRNQFQLADNESPDLLNVDIDPRGGFYTRQGWARWNPTDIVPVVTTGTWQPRNAFVHDTSTPGTQYVYVVNGTEVYIGNDAGAFSNVALPDVAGQPHGVDFASWGDGGYMWCADTLEVGVRRRNRVRWSHPGVPDAWRQDDFVDIEEGGGYITGLISYNDHLV